MAATCGRAVPHPPERFEKCQGHPAVVELDPRRSSIWRRSSRRRGAPDAGKRHPSPRTGRRDAAGGRGDEAARSTGSKGADGSRHRLTRRTRRRPFPWQGLGSGPPAVYTYPCIWRSLAARRYAVRQGLRSARSRRRSSPARPTTAPTLAVTPRGVDGVGLVAERQRDALARRTLQPGTPPVSGIRASRDDLQAEGLGRAARVAFRAGCAEVAPPGAPPIRGPALSGIVGGHGPDCGGSP